jgi:RimJ/RimL family protein N-acetyltransferase
VGAGYATQAIELACDIAFEKLNLHKLTAGSYENNVGSIRAFLKAGFHQEALLKDHYLCEGQWVSKVCLAKFNPRWGGEPSERIQA